MCLTMRGTCRARRIQNVSFIGNHAERGSGIYVGAGAKLQFLQPAASNPFANATTLGTGDFILFENNTR